MKHLTRDILLSPLAALVLAGCATMGVGHPRSAQQLMPAIRAHYTVLNTRIKKHQLTPFPNERFAGLKALFEELKSSPIELYTRDPELWNKYCVASIEAVEKLEQAWTTGDQKQIEQAFQVLKFVQDDAHRVFRGRRRRY